MAKLVTELLQPPEHIPPGFASLSQGVFHASTILFPDVASFLRRQEQAGVGYSYGQNGTPTQYALAEKLAQLEGGGHTMLVPSGLAAITLVSSHVLSAGDHVLLPAAVYGPTLSVTRELFGKWGVRCSVYQHSGADIGQLFEPRTRLVWVESPASNLLEMQDVPAIVAAAHAHGALVAMDNTWATPLGFRPLAHGVDFSIQALTKYVGGHSDLLMGAVTVADPRRYQELRQTGELLGYYVPPDECFLALRGLQTLGLRLERHFASALAMARMLERQAAVATVHYPPLPSDPGHALWRRDFKLGSGLLSFTLRQPGLPAVEAFVAALRFFRLGNSWGAVHSLVAVAPLQKPREGWLIRLHIGLEDVDDLLEDVRQALAAVSP
ncbi:trans-sulfuration enzyme family protein [Duganella radicis]|uniref:Cystathionine beta-lyase n=1 Tax=Duganella radicis TaxID=551988 RepID=A0A6L6PJY1_9BURK|nr:PLP-dependent transferase [Duganella radicis]MTV39272.1 cystathionine beta-lyase [Duganella radicis]